MKIAICASEVVPFAKTGGLADVTGALPLELELLNHEVIIIMPRYNAIQEPKFSIQRLKPDISYAVVGKNINPVRDKTPKATDGCLRQPISNGVNPVRDTEAFREENKISNGVKVYFIENDPYFNRDGLYGDKTGDYKDNLDRFSYYSKRTLELLKEIDFTADIIHCHDWQSALIPVYLKTLYTDNPFYQNTKTVFTIHNIGYQGLFSKEEFPKLGLDWKFFNMEMLEFYGKINLLKGGIVFSDIINTVSPTYSQEIQTKEFGYGLEGILTKRKYDVFGILNGLDYSIWNPKTDKFIIQNYSLQDLQDKYKNKEDLQRICRLPVKTDVALFGIVSRLAEQKGFDILADAIKKICNMNLQLVILGTGDLKYHVILENIVKKYPKIISLHLKFDDPLAHKIYAGSDVFLMPPKYEPCGLGQLISMSYGTIPLVFKTGGLADTVTEDDGFLFDKYKKEDLIKTIDKVIRAFKDKKKWLGLMRRVMQNNFSWKESAKKYLALYEKAKLR